MIAALVCNRQPHRNDQTTHDGFSGCSLVWCSWTCRQESKFFWRGRSWRSKKKSKKKTWSLGTLWFIPYWRSYFRVGPLRMAQVSRLYVGISGQTGSQGMAAKLQGDVGVTWPPRNWRALRIIGPSKLAILRTLPLLYRFFHPSIGGSKILRGKQRKQHSRQPTLPPTIMEVGSGKWVYLQYDRFLSLIMGERVRSPTLPPKCHGFCGNSRPNIEPRWWMHCPRQFFVVFFPHF